MSLKRNLIANYASQFYVTAAGIFSVPLFIKYMGAEAYGLVGFFSMLQVWFNLLDLGLTPTIARESARYHSSVMPAVAYRRLYRSLSLVFACITIIGGGALFAMAEAVTDHWLNIQNLSSSEVTASVQIMAICVALRWMGGLYRGVISGSERLVWLGGFNALIATLRFVGVLGSMWVWGFTPIVFFWHQLVVAAIEVVGLHAMCHRILPSDACITEPIGWSFRPIQPLMRFSLTIAFTSSVWVLVTQTDKLILSGVLSLTQYGFFTLAVLVASTINIISGPISMAIMPRMARLHAETKHNEVLRLYKEATQLVSVFAGSLTITLVVCAEPLLFAWTGSREVTESTAPILRLYAIGNGLLALGAFPYYLQYARGNLRYHLIGNVALIAILIPAIIVAAMKYGGVGAGWVWVVMNALYLFYWVGYVHSKLEPGLHWNWLINNVCIIVLPTILCALVIDSLQLVLNIRAHEFVHVAIVAIASALIATMTSSVLRHAILQAARSRKFRGAV